MKDFNILFQKLIDIKESWEIFKLFEAERQKFIKDTNEYRDELEKSQELLAKVRAQITEGKQELESLHKQIEAQKNSIALLEEKKTKAKIKAQIKTLEEQKENLKASQKEILPSSLKSIEVFDENGEIKLLKSVRHVYDSEVFNKYRVALKENRILRDKIAEFELSNSQLKIELRDLYSEIAIKEREENALKSNKKQTAKSQDKTKKEK